MIAEDSWLLSLKSGQSLKYQFSLDFCRLQVFFSRIFLRIYFIYVFNVINRKSSRLVVKYSAVKSLDREQDNSHPKSAMPTMFLSVRIDLGNPILCRRLRRDHPVCATYSLFMISLPKSETISSWIKKNETAFSLQYSDYNSHLWL